MPVYQNSRYARATQINIVDSDGLPTQPPYLDILPRLERMDYEDNRPVVVAESDTWPSLGFAYLHDPTAWWAAAEFSGVIDPFEELQPGVILAVPSERVYYFTILKV